MMEDLKYPLMLYCLQTSYFCFCVFQREICLQPQLQTSWPLMRWSTVASGTVLLCALSSMTPSGSEVPTDMCATVFCSPGNACLFPLKYPFIRTSGFLSYIGIFLPDVLRCPRHIAPYQINIRLEQRAESSAGRKTDSSLTDWIVHKNVTVKKIWHISPGCSFKVQSMKGSS